MTAVPIYVWNGSAWQETGPTIPASPIAYQASAPSSPATGDIWVDSDGDVTTGSQQFQRFRFVASGGETTISGVDANGAVLAYTAGLEQVVLNGAVLVRGHDYTATNGTTISGLSPALVANDVLEVFSFIAFTVANTYTQSQVDGLLDSYIGLRLITPTSAVNGTVGTTGAVTFSGASSVSINGCFSSAYNNYKIVITGMTAAANASLNIRLRANGTDESSGSNFYKYHFQGVYATGTTFAYGNNGTTSWADVLYLLNTSDNGGAIIEMELANPFASVTTSGFARCYAYQADTTTRTLRNGGISHTAQTSYDGFSLLPTASNITGTVRVYGYKN